MRCRLYESVFRYFVYVRELSRARTWSPSIPHVENKRRKTQKGADSFKMQLVEKTIMQIIDYIYTKN